MQSRWRLEPNLAKCGYGWWRWWWWLLRGYFRWSHQQHFCVLLLLLLSMMSKKVTIVRRDKRMWFSETHQIIIRIKVERWDNWMRRWRNLEWRSVEKDLDFVSLEIFSSLRSRVDQDSFWNKGKTSAWIQGWGGGGGGGGGGGERGGSCEQTAHDGIMEMMERITKWIILMKRMHMKMLNPTRA